MAVSKVMLAMDSELNPTPQRKLNKEEENLLEEYTEPYRTCEHRPVFHATSDGDWKLEAVYSQGVFWISEAAVAVECNQLKVFLTGSQRCVLCSREMGNEHLHSN
jgi:hypothetical protein